MSAHEEARAIARPVTEPQLLLYDEPTPNSTRDVRHDHEIIATLREQTPSPRWWCHDRELAFAIADHMRSSWRRIAPPAGSDSRTHRPDIANFLNPVIDLKNPHLNNWRNDHDNRCKLSAGLFFLLGVP